MLPQDKPLDYQTEEEHLKLQRAWRHTFAPASFAQLQTPVPSVCEDARGVCSGTTSPLFPAVENLCLLSSFSYWDNVVALWMLDIPHWEEQQRGQLPSAALCPFPSPLLPPLTCL